MLDKLKSLAPDMAETFEDSFAESAESLLAQQDN
jgi:hypothetical protein